MRLRMDRTLIPWTMAAARAALGPVIALGQAARWDGSILASMVVAALLSDIFDGVLARRWKCDTAAVRLFDSMADTVFYIGVAIALWVGHRTQFHTHWPLLALLIGLETLRFSVDFARFGKPASYHSWAAKTWGFIMAIAVIMCFAVGDPGSRVVSAMLTAALLAGIACDLEGLAMSAVLPAWRRDVKSLAAAWRLRRELLATPVLTVPPGA